MPAVQPVNLSLQHDLSVGSYSTTYKFAPPVQSVTFSSTAYQCIPPPQLADGPFTTSYQFVHLYCAGQAFSDEAAPPASSPLHDIQRPAEAEEEDSIAAAAKESELAEPDYVLELRRLGAVLKSCDLLQGRKQQVRLHSGLQIFTIDKTALCLFMPALFAEVCATCGHLCTGTNNEMQILNVMLSLTCTVFTSQKVHDDTVLLWLDMYMGASDFCL